MQGTADDDDDEHDQPATAASTASASATATATHGRSATQGNATVPRAALCAKALGRTNTPPLTKTRSGVRHALNAPETEMEAGRPVDVPFPVATRALHRAPAGEGSSEHSITPGGLYRVLRDSPSKLDSR